MSYTLKDLANISAAIAGGYRTVKYDGKEVQFQSAAELIKTRQLIEDDLRARGLLSTAGTTSHGGTTFAAYDPN